MGEMFGSRRRVTGAGPVWGWPRRKSRLFSASGLALALLAACASGGSKHILVRPHPMGVQSLPQEMVSVLLDRDYERVRVRETGIDWGAAGYTDESAHLVQQQGSTVVTTSEYRMLFRSRDNPASFVRVRVKRNSGRTRLTFYEEGREDLSLAAQRRLRLIEDDLALRYGKDRVQVK